MTTTLRICHLLDALLLDLSLGASCQQIHLSLLRRTDDQLEELLMVPNRVIDQREVCRARFIWSIEDSAVRIDLEHVDRSIGCHTIVATRVAIAVHGFEQTRCLIA